MTEKEYTVNEYIKLLQDLPEESRKLPMFHNSIDVENEHYFNPCCKPHKITLTDEDGKKFEAIYVNYKLEV